MKMCRTDRLITFLLLTLSISIQADTRVLDMRERANVINGWLDERIDTLLPQLMRQSGIDMWLIISSEYNEDPVLESMLPATWLSARRRTILLINQPENDEPLETLAIARYDVGTRFRQSWDKEVRPDQWQALADLIVTRDPARIGINVSPVFPLADGLSHGEYEQLIAALPERYRQRLVPATELAIGWLETRTPGEMGVYPQIVRIAHEIIARGLSEAVIQPGVTTTDDVAWWYRDRIRQRGLTTWFHPSVSIQRAQQADDDHGSDVPDHPDGSDIILPGDLLHVDFGITYLRLNTDTQQHAYVLRPGETEAPESLQQAMAVGNRLQDILTGNFRTGRSGNEILAQTLAQATDEGIEASIYTHPLGYHGHAAGPTIGLWDQQEGVPGRGDYPLNPNTVHSIELYAATFIPEWDRKVRIRLEEDAFFDGSSIRYLDGRQTRLLLIPRPAAETAKIAQ